MLTSTPVNASLKPAAPAAGPLPAGRPVSLIAAIGVLAGSLYISHVGLAGVFGAGELAGVMTLLLVCFSTLQWMSMGRARAARLAGADSQARLTIANAALLFVLEAVLNTMGVVQLAAKAGADWGAGAALMFAIAIAAGIAWFNLTVKFAACEALQPTPASPRAEAEIDPSPGARAPNVYDLTQRQRELAVSPERDGLRAIVAGEAAHRREVYERHQSRIDPATKQFRTRRAAATRKRRAA